MVNYKYKDLYWKPHIDKQITISVDNSSLKFINKDIDWENFELTESLHSESELRFGSCEASMLKFRIHNNFVSLKNKWLTITEILDGKKDSIFQFGRYKVDSDVPTADRKYRDVTAYDIMYDILNANMAKWYNKILPKKDSTVTLKYFRTSFISHFGLEQSEPQGGLVNDEMIVKRTIKPEQISGKDIITAICEINGCFGHIGRDGKFHYIYLNQDIMGLYPSNTLFPDHAPDYLPQSETGHLYPQDPQSTNLGTVAYISGDYEDFLVKPIKKIQIRKEENDIGGQYPEEDVSGNSYIIEDNFLVYEKNSSQLKEIAQNLYEKITNIIYRPFSCEAVGNPCLEVGDGIRFSTKYELVESYILNRTLKGIQGLRDSYSAEGKETYSEKVNSVSKSIIQLKGKTNILERNVDETKSEIKDVDSKLSSRIEQTVKSISMSVTNDKTGKTAEVKLLLTDEGGTQYEVTADKIDFTGLVSFKNLEDSGETTINGDNIKTGTIQSINIKNGDVLENGEYPFSVDENGNAEMKSATITGGSFNINDKFTVDKSGNVEMKSATINGNVTAVNGFSLQYTNETVKPSITKTYKFVKTGYNNPVEGGMINEPFLNIYSPSGKRVIAIGTSLYDEYPDKFKNKDVPFFPNGAMIEDVYIDSLHYTFTQRENIIESGGQDSNGEEILGGQNTLMYKVRKSGVFVCFAGTYRPYIHRKNEIRYFNLNNIAEYFPTNHSTRTVGYASERMFLFQLTPQGELRVRNIGENLETSMPPEVNFRFDYFIFP